MREKNLGGSDCEYTGLQVLTNSTTTNSTEIITATVPKALILYLYPLR